LLYSTPDEGSKLPRAVQKNLPEKRISLPEARPFDIQLVGIEHWHSFDQSWSFDEYRRLYAPILYGLPATRVEGGGNRLKLFWSGPTDRPSSDVTVVLDAAAGYRPVRTESYSKFPDRKGYEPEGWTSTEWTKIDDVFAPKRWHAEASRSKAVTDMEFEWRRVNGPVPDRLFTLEGLRLPHGTTIMNLKTGQPIREGKIGDTLAAADPPPIGPEPARRLRWVLAAHGAVLLVAVGAFASCRRRG
jgi:hypothetical protein